MNTYEETAGINVFLKRCSWNFRALTCLFVVHSKSVMVIFAVLHDINMLTDATHGMVWSKTGEPYQYDILSHWGAVNDENLQTAIAQDAFIGKMLTNGTCKSLRGLYIITFGETRGGDKMRVARRTMFFRSKHQLNRMLQQKTIHVQSQSTSIFLEAFW